MVLSDQPNHGSVEMILISGARDTFTRPFDAKISVEPDENMTHFKLTDRTIINYYSPVLLWNDFFL